MNPPAAPDDAVLRQRVLEILTRIAPDVDPASVRPDLEFRDQFEFDSMDLFNFAAAVHQGFGIDIPEKDYRQLDSLDHCTGYLRRRLAEPQAPAAGGAQ